MHMGNSARVCTKQADFLASFTLVASLLVLLCLALLPAPSYAAPWDASNSDIAHAHQELSGGVHSVSFSDTRPKWAESSVPSRSSASCRDGYYNTGISCYRTWPPDTLAGGMDAMTCPNGTTKDGAFCITCPQGQSYWGGICYINCPDDAVRTAVSTCVHTLSMSGNTHLWVVNRAIDLLAYSDDPLAKQIAALMNTPAVRTQWEQGLWDGDDDTYKDGASLTKLGTHFYNAAGKDYFGNATTLTTYEFIGYDSTATVQGNNPNARDMAKSFLGKVTLAGLQSADPSASAHALGLVLHYASDMTQPMHTSSFSALSVPLMLHPYYEFYVPSIQARYPASADWDKRWLGQSADATFVSMSAKSNGYAKDLMDKLHIDGGSGICTIPNVEGIGPYTGYCFTGDPDVDAVTGQILTDGYQSMASFIYAAFVDKGMVFTNTQTVNLVAVHSDKCLDVTGRSGDDGVVVIQYSCTGGDNQKWILSTTGDSTTIVAKHSGKCLDLDYGKAGDGVKIQQWTCNGGNNQLWRLIPVGDNGYKIVSVATGGCLDIWTGGIDSLLPLKQGTCKNSNNGNQRFKLVPAS